MEFQAKTLRSLDKLPQNDRGWLYRGQRSVEWPLKTSLERCCDRENVPAKDHLVFEIRLLRQFRRAYHHYSCHVPSPANTLEWLSLMQHHGAPTRLLDFTYSAYVAAYFALEDATTDQDCVVWAINGRWALRESITLMNRSGKKNAELLQKLYEEEDMENIPRFFWGDPAVPCACPQNPFRLNERLQIQKGVFLIPGSVEIPFEENLCQMPGHDDSGNIFKLIIPFASRREALRQLFEMNISRTSLFPGLDGYARSLGVYTPDFEAKLWSEDI